MKRKATASACLRSILAGSVVCCALALPSSLLASVATLSIEGMQTPTGSSSDPMLAFALAAEGENPDSITHLITGPLVPLSDETPTRLGSYYSGVNSATGDVQEVGLIAVQASISSVDSATASAPIGIIARSGKWSDQAKTPLDTTIGGSRAFATYQPSTFSIAGGESFSYEVIDADTVMLDPFELVIDGNTVSFGATSLTRYGSIYRGLVAGLDADGFGDAALMLSLEVPDDSDADSIPNLTDSSAGGATWYEPYTLAADGMITSTAFEHFWFAWGAPDYVYHKNHGWWYIQPSAANLFAYDFVLGWLWTSSEAYPAIYRYDTGDWLSFNSGGEGGTRWFWNFSSNPNDWLGVATSL